MALTAAELKATYKVDESELDKSIGGLPGKIEGAAGKLAAAGLVIGGALGAGLLGGMENERVNDRLAAQLGLTAPESARVGKVAGQLYADAYGDSLGGVNDAVGAVMSSIGGMRDASSADLEAMTAKALDFATAFEVDVARSTQIAGQMITQGLAKDGTEAFDLLVSASQQVPAAIREDLLDATDEYGGFFADLGYTGPQAMALLVDASEKGMYGIDKLGDAVKEFGIRATDMSTASAVGYDLIGESQEEMTARLLAGGDTASTAFQEIIAGVQAIEDPVKKSQAALALFGTPLEDLSVQEIPAFLDALAMSKGELENVSGAAERLGDTLNDNASTALTEMKRGAEQAVVGLANELLPAIMDVAGWLKDTFGPAVKEVGEFLGENETAVKAVAVALGTAATIFGVVTGITKAWAAAQAVLNVVLAANPIGIIVLAIAALVAGLIYAYQNSETFRDIVTGAFDAVKRGVGNAVGFMIDGFRGLLMVFLTVADGIVSGAAKALGWIPGLGDKLQAANTAFDNMKDGILDTLDDAAQKAYGFGEDSGRNAASGLSATQQAAWNAGRSVGGQMGGGVGAGAGDAYNAGHGVGVNAALGLEQGMRSRQFAVAKQAQILAITAGRAMQTGLQERSPSRWTMWMGEMLGEGLVIGIRRSEGDVMRAMGGLTGRITGIPAPTIGVRAPAMAGGVTAPAAAPSGGGYSDAGRGPLFAADTVNIVEGTPVDVARQLELGARTRGAW